MRLAYRRNNQTIEILRCWCEGTKVQIPEEIDGLPVTAVGKYAFSPGYEKDGEELYYEERFLKAESEETVFCGNVVECVEFPKTLEAVGNYAFYGCRNLAALAFSDRLARLGAGVFTGCRQNMKLSVDLYDGEATCLKEICGEIRYELEVILRHHFGGQDAAKGTASGQEARLIFPEHYEEAVENTPARILFTQHHGSGNHFRQCFLSRNVQYADYDALFPLAEAQESMEVLARLIYGRLAYPYRLSGQAKEAYRNFGRQNAGALAACYLEQDLTEGLFMLTGQELWNEEALEQTIRKASDEKRAEALSYLMQEKHRLFPPKKKTFDL